MAGPMGVYCGRVLADLGADVVLVEPPQGHPMRRLPPFKDDVPHHERSLYFQYYNLGKRGITLSLETADGRSIFRSLVERSDAVIETFPVGYLEGLGLGYSALREVNPGIVVASITPFGQTGPYRSYRASDLVGFAVGAPLQLSGTPDGPPCVAPGQLAYDCAALCAAIGVLAALQARWLTGLGQHVDISLQEATVGGTADWTIPYMSYATVSEESRRAYQQRMIRRSGSIGAGLPGDIFPCKDGFVKFCVIPQTMWRSFLDWIGGPAAISGPEWDSLAYRQQHHDLVDAYTIDFTVQRTKAELFEEGQKRGIAITPFYRPDEFVADAQPQARRFFVEVTHPVMGTFAVPGAPYRLSGTPAKVRRPAPLLAEHNCEIYCGELGLSRSELALLKQAGVV